MTFTVYRRAGSRMTPGVSHYWSAAFQTRDGSYPSRARYNYCECVSLGRRQEGGVIRLAQGGLYAGARAW